MAWCRWAATALLLTTVVAALLWWSERPVPEQLAFHSITDSRFSQLRRQAAQFVEARPRQGFQFVERQRDVAFQIRCNGVPVLLLERRPQHLLLWTSLDAKQRAPAVVRLQALLQWQLEPLDYLEQVLAGVPEPVLLDRVLQSLASDVPDGARCGVP
ncbi:hypothetical protein N5J01_04255 [Stenotrophomonas sp. GD03701]|uniref:Uncharacterized protein n=1 Tax=Stenotrophomonas maltophilia TaxID=40324 RepID=A0A2J0SLT6_STEMA|nr:MULTISPECIES: hypothetical protein [Stenotrophomonas]MBA0310660.1 hypothetical protein [Stenotrophomonas maltophilia]MDH1387615.1 hypothetical protein [Stenotrophomonas sp. GD03701]MDH1393336.1 hypothetical protein [Stenotrophomonas sp. GD03702]MDQ7302745.1 hypothetical protein [Stenotrophomonas sp. Sm0581]PJK98241.1 hypothetical protein B9Y57_11110 [Stenotrophomonas maltophilia]